jgi:phytoene dehydrogenase-like protein
MPDVIVVGGGLNGLVAAAVLAKRKVSTLLLERRPTVGGAAITSELAPGFRVPRLSHGIGPLRRDVVRALGLERARGLEFITPDPALTSLGENRQTISFHPDPILTAAAISPLSSDDAGRWREFIDATQRISRVAAAISRHPAPSLEEATMRQQWRLLEAGRRLRSLDRKDLARLARWLAMPVCDLFDEWFRNDLLKAALAARAVFGNFAGPCSPGTGAIWLQRLVDDRAPAGSGTTVRGGPGALSDAVRAVFEQAGGQVRTQAQVSRITTKNGRVTGVVLANGDKIAARAVVSAVDPRQTFLGLVEPEDLAPTFLDRARNYRARGVTAKVNLALAALPDFVALRGDPIALRGRLLVAPDMEYLERAFDAAKYGDFSPRPWLELSIPSTIDSSLAPEGQHVMSIYVQFAPRQLRDADWSVRRERLFDAAMGVLEPHAPALGSLIVAAEVITPGDLEQIWGLSGGHIFHGEPTLDQSWAARPFLGWAQYRTPLEGLYLASAGTHPGGGLTGGSGWLAAQTIARDLRARRK